MVLRHVLILRDHPQGVCLYLAKGTGILPEDDLLRSKHVRVPLNILKYFNEINTLN